MEWLKRLAERLRGTREEKTRAVRAPEDVRVPLVERRPPQKGPEVREHAARARAEEAELVLTRSAPIAAQGTRADTERPADALEQWTIYCRRCASDITAQSDL